MKIEELCSSLLLITAMYLNHAHTVIAVVSDAEMSKRPTKRKYWVNPLNSEKIRREQGDHYNLIREMRQFDETRFAQHLRMTPNVYDKLLRLVTPLISKDTSFRRPIDPGTRLEVTLRYLATGSTSTQLANEFRLGRSTIPKIIDDTLPAIYKPLFNTLSAERARPNI